MLRFNNAPTKGYEKDVGSKTTIRILNSQVVTKPQFQFLTSPMYKRLKLLMWDPSNYTASIDEVDLSIYYRIHVYNFFFFYAFAFSGSSIRNIISYTITWRSEKRIRSQTSTSSIRNTCGVCGTTYKTKPPHT